MSSLYLGLDLSTQQLKALIVGEQLEVVRQETVHFDTELPEFGSVHYKISG
jgi:xylulokinase